MRRIGEEIGSGNLGDRCVVIRMDEAAGNDRGITVLSESNGHAQGASGVAGDLDETPPGIGTRQVNGVDAGPPPKQ